ncbi:MAG: citramalate synthase [Oscillospiraceae bacterium]|jgi:2-isopropylmalate synthase|nr:citramalate synthase [Oscillospiraceae bacterium]
MITILDSTLRDGAQGEGVSFSVSDKIEILRTLASFGIPFIEAGNPSSNDKDRVFFDRVKTLPLKNSKVVAFGSTRRKNSPARSDTGLLSLLTANTEYVSVFGKTSVLHVREILGCTLKENLDIISDSVQFLVSNGRQVFFDAEHFFDGFKEDKDYALACLRAAKRAGANTLVLCDTNGGSFPFEVSAITAEVVKTLGTAVGIHCHNDTGCAVANTIAAVLSGAAQVQGTFVGIGERTGNAALSTVIGDLQGRLDIRCVPDLSRLTDTARRVAELSNIALPNRQPFVGRSAFAHKGGMHADGVRKLPRSFEHIEPSLIGNDRSFPLSEMSGKSAVLAKLRHIYPDLAKNDLVVQKILNKVKSLENDGFQFEAADASFELLVLKEKGEFTPHFEIADYKIISTQQTGGGFALASASVKVKVGDDFEITADEGDGPVNAIDKALRKALAKFYPKITQMRLTDYKVRVVDTVSSTAATTRVLIESTDGTNVWTTVGASKDIICASILALADSVEYLLI